MAIKQHSELQGGDVHTPFRWIVEDEAELQEVLEDATSDDDYNLLLRKDIDGVYLYRDSTFIPLFVPTLDEEDE